MKIYSIILDWAYDDECDNINTSLEYAKGIASNCVFEVVTEKGPSGWPEVKVYTEVLPALIDYLKIYNGDNNIDFLMDKIETVEI